MSWVLEEAGFTATVQAWDFGAGANFILEMQRAASEAPRTIAVLSPAYLASPFAAPEWAAAFAADPEGLKHQLVPVQVRECRLAGLWKAITHINLVGLDEAVAQQRLLSGLTGKRGKPIERPAFPGSIGGRPPVFPGRDSPTEAQYPTPYMPKMRVTHSDLDKRRFLRGAFRTTAQHFERALTQLSEAQKGIEVDFNADSTSSFTAEIFENGKSRTRCKIWVSSEFGEGIAFYEGNSWIGANAMNEILVVIEGEEQLLLSAQMSAITFGRVAEGLDLKHLSPQEGAEYLWRRFVQRIE
jgi:hypothetical protein